MSFLDNIFATLERNGQTTVLEEIRDGQTVGTTGADLLDQVSRARASLVSRGLMKGDRFALYANNGVRWVAMDLAAMAEGLIVVPLYARQAPAELVAMMKDCAPAMICCADSTLRDGILREWPAAPTQLLFDDIFAAGSGASTQAPAKAVAISDSDAVTIIYTSGTSGEAKGVVLNAGNIAHMLGCVNARLDLLMAGHDGQDRVFHYLPFVFAGSWMLLMKL